jgi:hypothetical protein
VWRVQCGVVRMGKAGDSEEMAHPHTCGGGERLGGMG